MKFVPLIKHYYSDQIKEGTIGMGDMTNAYTVFARNFEMKISFGSIRQWEVNTKMDLKQSVD
jgi:hypothetical protein